MSSLGIGSSAPQPLLAWHSAVAGARGSSVEPAVGQGGRVAEPGAAPGQVSPEQQAQIAQLSKTDRDVRQHEQAHMAAGAGLVTSGASFTYTRGPDGRNYAVGGEVGIDTSEGRTPAETLARAQQVQAAAMAPAQPSGQDHSVAAAAAQMAMQARVDMAREQAQAAQSGAQPQSREQVSADKSSGASQHSDDMLPYGVLMYQQVMSMAFGRLSPFLSVHA